MNSKVVIVVIALCTVVGVVVADLVNRPDDHFYRGENKHQAPDPLEVMAEAVRVTEDLLSLEKSVIEEASSEDEDAIIEGLEVVASEIDELKSAVTRISDTLVLMEEHAQRPVNRGELHVKLVTRDLLEPALVGQLYATSREPDLRREAITILSRIAATDAKALKTVASLIEDEDEGVQSSAMGALTRFVDSKSDREARLELLEALNVERSASALYFANESGSLKSASLRLLTELGSATVTSYWQERFDANAKNSQRQVAAAKALQQSGNPGPFSQLLNAAVSELQSTDRRVSSRAARVLRSLGGEEANAALRALRK